MKITRDTPGQLIVESRPWLLSLLLVGFVMIFVGVGLFMTLTGDLTGLVLLIAGGGIGMLAIWAFVRRVQVIFHRDENYCERREKSLTGMTRVRHRLDEIAGAVIEESRSSKGQTLRRIALDIDAGPSKGRHPIINSYDNFSKHPMIADRINAWLSENNTRSETNERPPLPGGRP